MAELVDATDLKSVGLRGSCGFESHPRHLLNTTNKLLSKFLSSRRQGLSPRILDFYKGYLDLASSVIGTDIKGEEIEKFLDSLSCSNGGKIYQVSEV